MVNKIILIGNLGRDPELRRLENGTVISKFSLATSEKYNGQTNTEWHNITLFGKLAELSEQYLKKGHRVYIEGKMTYGEFETKDGQKVKTADVIANTMRFMESVKTDEPRQEREVKVLQREPQPQTEPDDDLPF